MRKRLNRLPAAALVAASAIGLSTGAGMAQTGPSAPHQSWQLRAQVRSEPGASLSHPRTLPDAMGLVHEAACRGATDLLRHGEPARTRVQLTLWRQPGPTDATGSGSPDMGCHVRPGRRRAFRLRGRVSGDGGWVGPPRALHRVAELANDLAPKVMYTGDQVWITLRLGTAEKPVRGLIRSLARRYGVSVSTSLRVAGCESHFNPRAYDYPYAGVYQQDVRYWVAGPPTSDTAGTAPSTPMPTSTSA